MILPPQRIPLTKLKTVYSNCYEELVKLSKLTDRTIHESMDNYLFKYGIDVVLIPVTDDDDYHLGYKSVVKIRRDNKLNRNEDRIVVIENYKKYKLAPKAHKVTTLYALNILEEHLALSSPSNESRISFD
ncbi:MAG: hypothetical protein ACTHJT_13620 [Cytophaga sp.]|uniref:hypothetical protein n=1 Tax=Cytophaga sp. TaxID=29535 RepID=UPI003F821386